MCVLSVCQVEHMLETEDYGKDLATVQNLVKKHQLLEADIDAHEVHYTNTHHIIHYVYPSNAA